MTDRTDVELESYTRLSDRFWSHVDQSGGPDACWPWKIGRNPKGYGNFQFKRSGAQFTFTAARWALGYALGRPLEWTEDLREEACHTCDNPPCCNPAHLYVGSQRDNIRDAWDRGRFAGRRNANSKKTHCHVGHPLSGDNLYLDVKRGKRECRACGAAKARRYRAERRTG